MRLMCLVREKIYVSFYNFQDLAHSMINIALKGRELRHDAIHGWYDHTLPEFITPLVGSPFRAATPRILDNAKRVELREVLINKYMFKLETCIKNRKLYRKPAFTREIKR